MCENQSLVLTYMNITIYADQIFRITLLVQVATKFIADESIPLTVQTFSHISEQWFSRKTLCGGLGVNTYVRISERISFDYLVLIYPGIFAKEAFNVTKLIAIVPRRVTINVNWPIVYY